jgi:hypothetical protein
LTILTMVLSETTHLFKITLTNKEIKL